MCLVALVAQPSSAQHASVGLPADCELILNGSATESDALYLTNGEVNRVGSAFCREPVDVVAFSTDFSFQLQNPGADGFMFVLQGQGPQAVGEYGINLGFAGKISSIQKSVGIKFDLYDNAGEGSNSTGLFVKGSTPTTPAEDLTSTGIDLHSGHIFAVHLTYDGLVLTVELRDTVTGTYFSTTYQVDIPSIVGGPTAFVGFTAGTGGLTAIQKVIAWNYTSALPTSNLPITTGGKSNLAASPSAAARLLDQATFGPTANDIVHVQQIGLTNYLQEQYALPTTNLQKFGLPVPSPCDSGSTCFDATWWKNVINAQDQVRQRVAFALSHIFVTSTLAQGGYAMVPYYNILINDAFANWRTLMQDVTLSPVMGSYLSMVNNAKAATGQIANENFARENLQLFNLGAVLLNEDGSNQTDTQGRPIPAYTQEQVEAFARAFTGWTFATSVDSRPQDLQGDPQLYGLSMVPVQSEHDSDTKTLLQGVTLRPGQSAEQDLKDSLDNIFLHPNLPPFVCRQLIQHLVTSSPSPAYVARVSRVFMDNGLGVRGDLKAVITAILLDEEARAGDTNASFDGGHLREPLLFLANVLRALPYTPEDTSTPWGYWAVSWTVGHMGEAPVAAPSVFYFYSPSYSLPGTARLAPEFGLESVANISALKVLVDQVIYGQVAHMKLDLNGDTDLMSRADRPSDLVEELSFLFMHSQMPDRMKEIIINTVAAAPDLSQRVRVALDLTLTSSHYKILH